MTTPYNPGSPSGHALPPEPDSPSDFEINGSSSENTSSASDNSKPDEAKHQASQVKDSAADAAANVAQTSKEQVQQVTDDVRQQARMLAGETKTQLTEQANSQRERAVTTLRTLGDELTSMSDGISEPGLGSQLAREGSQLTQKAADFLNDREPGQIIEEIRGFARRRPGTFLLGAAVAGVIVGRLTRGAVSANTNDGASSQPGPSSPTDEVWGAHVAIETPAHDGVDSSPAGPAYGVPS